MSLPKIKYPLFDVTIPSLQKKVKMRPFLVKEEKLLLIAQSTGNPADTMNAIKQVINNCFVDDVDVDMLTTFDLEYLFVKLRSRSVNNKIEVMYRDPDDNEQYKVVVDLEDVQILNQPGHTNKITINDQLGIILRYPKPDMVDRIGSADSEVDLYFEIVKYCIEKVYDDDNVYNINDYSDEELTEFLSTLDVSTFKQIQNFMETMPKVYYETSYTNKAGVVRKVVLQTLDDFFSLG